VSETPLESPSEDVAEQRTEAYRVQQVRGTGDPGDAFEADPADVRDQADEVPLDDEDYQ
jgi:hypothetical protein